MLRVIFFCLNQTACETHFTNVACVFPCAAEDAYILLVHPPPLSLPSPLQEPLKNNSRALGTLLIWSRRAQGKSELYFLQNTDQRGKHWLCFRGAFHIQFVSCFLFFFSSPFLLFCLLVHFCLFFPPLCSACLSCQSSFSVYVVSFSIRRSPSAYSDQFSVLFLFMPLSLSSAAVFSTVCFICQAPGKARHWPHAPTYNHSRRLCDRNLRVHTDSLPRCSQIFFLLHIVLQAE